MQRKSGVLTTRHPLTPSFGSPHSPSSETGGGLFLSLTAQSQTRKLVTGNKLSDVSERRRDSSLIIIDKTVCKRIIYYRQKLKLSQEELASNVGINLKHLIKIEAGLKIPRINELVQLATGLGISIDELVNNK